MYLIEFDKVCDIRILDKMYHWLGESGILTKTYIMHTIDKETEIIKDFPFHFVRIDLKSMGQEDNDALLDLIMFLEYGSSKIVIDETGVPLEYMQKLIHYCDTLKIEYELIGKENLSNIDLYSEGVAYVIKELLNHPDIDKGTEYSFKDFLLKFKIDSEGVIYNQLGEKVGSVWDKSLYRVFLNITLEHMKLINNIEDKMNEAREIGISLNLVDPWCFLGGDLVPDDIIRYKERVFNMIKYIKPDIIGRLPLDTAVAIYESRFLPLDDIEAVENKNHDLFITDWFIEAVQKK